MSDVTPIQQEKIGQQLAEIFGARDFHISPIKPIGDGDYLPVMLHLEGNSAEAANKLFAEKLYPLISQFGLERDALAVAVPAWGYDVFAHDSKYKPGYITLLVNKNADTQHMLDTLQPHKAEIQAVLSPLAAQKKSDLQPVTSDIKENYQEKIGQQLAKIFGAKDFHISTVRPFRGDELPIILHLEGTSAEKLDKVIDEKLVPLRATFGLTSRDLRFAVSAYGGNVFEQDPKYKPGYLAILVPDSPATQRTVDTLKPHAAEIRDALSSAATQKRSNLEPTTIDPFEVGTFAPARLTSAEPDKKNGLKM